jgi:hypothetical protein
MIGDKNAPNQIYENYFAKGCHLKLLDEGDSGEVKAVQEKCASHLYRMGLGTPLLNDMTVSRIVNRLVENQGKLIEGPVATAFESILDDCLSMTPTTPLSNALVALEHDTSICDESKELQSERTAENVTVPSDEIIESDLTMFGV